MDLFRSRKPAAEGSDDERFDALYREHYGRILAYALRRGTPEVAHDVVADTFLVAWRRLDRLPDEPLPWLFGVARKTLANHRRSAQRRDALLTQLKAHHGVGTQADAEPAAVTVAEIADALERLPRTDLELLQLIAWDGMTVFEAAQALGIAAPAARVRLHRARRRLSTELARGAEVRTPPREGRFPPRLAKDTRP